MARGFVWSYYHSDDGRVYALEVERDYAAMPERGWTYPAAAGTTIYPRGWSPRKVIGLDEDGHPRSARIGTTGADLWTGAATTFVINGSDDLPHTCHVFRRLGERMGRHP